LDSILRAAFFYLVLLLVFRLSPKRSLDSVTPFEFILLLMIGGLAVPAMQAGDLSMANALLLILTLLGLNVALAYLKFKFPRFARILSGTPLLVYEKGELKRERLEKLLIEDQDVLTAVREAGLERLEQAKWVIAERNGKLVVVQGDK